MCQATNAVNTLLSEKGHVLFNICINDEKRNRIECGFWKKYMIQSKDFYIVGEKLNFLTGINGAPNFRINGSK